MKTWKRALALVLALVMALSLVALPSFAEGEEKDTYSVVINYVFADGSQAAPSWTATLARGSAYHNTVTSPTVVGYTPDKGSVELNFAAIHKDETYKVTYSPALVDVTVRHLLQNAEGDNYTLDESQNLKMRTGSDVGGNLAKTYPGFTALLYETTTKVAADGSTVVEIKYDRNYYLLNLNLDGGWGVEPIYARYGAPVSLGTPVKAGYTFNGWNPEFALTTMPAQDTTYTAQWKAPDSAKVTVVIWGENANDEGYSYYDSINTTGKPGETFNASGIIHEPYTLANYGIVATASGVTPEEEAVKYFTKLGLEDGKIYYFNDRGSSSNGDKYYYYTDGSFYEYDSKPTDYIGTQLGRESCSEGFLHTTDYFYKYEAKRNASSGIWTLRKSDTATVSADGTTVVNVYYDRVEKTLHFRKANSSSDTYGTITAKWGASIRDQFNAKSKAAGTSNWSENSDASGPWTSYLDAMPAKDMTFYAYTKGSGTSTAYYYVEGLDGKDKLYYENVSTGTGYTVTVEEFIRINGFTFNADRSAKVGDKFDNSKFYYTRNSYNLVFNDGVKDVKTETVKYEESLSGYGFTPTIPADLYEKDSRVFAGWYLNPECTGEEYKLNEHTMPADNVLLYAKWAPVEHKVTYSQTEGGDRLYEEDVPHGSLAGYGEEPTYNKRTFVGWFYKDENGVEHAFHPSMPVRRNMDLYAKWRTDVAMSYTIRYAIQNENGSRTYIAEDTTGSALAESTKTFEAKTGADLYADYRTGYFPQVSSHSMVISLDNPEQNEYTFIYVKKQAVNYTVRYLEKGTNTVLHEDKKDSTSAAVVTEKFVAINGYAPDAYQKRLVLSADENQNVITFWYVRDEVHAPVQIIHWVQNIAGDGYTEYQSSTNLNGVINKTYSADPIAITGFEYARGTVEAGASVTVVPAGQNPSGTLTADGLVLNLYYDRIQYPYEFRFVNSYTGEDITDYTFPGATKGNARFGDRVTYTAPERLGDLGYKLDTAKSSASQAIDIRIEDPANVAKLNVKTFYYIPYFNVVHVQRDPATENVTRTPNEVDLTTSIVDNRYDLTAQVAAGYLYGGSFSDAACTVVQEYGAENPTSFTPTRGQTYYIWEVPDTYLRPSNYRVARHIDGVQTLCKLYPLTTADRLLYKEVGFSAYFGNDTASVVDIKSGSNNAEFETPVANPGAATVYQMVKAARNGKVETTVYVMDGKLSSVNADITDGTANGKPIDPGYIGGARLTDDQFAKFKTDGITYTPYWITLDGVKVTGTMQRNLTFDASEPNVAQIKRIPVATTCTYVEDTPAVRLLNFATAFNMDDSQTTVDTRITVTVQDGASTYTTKVQPGDPVELTPNGQDGKLFAGWYVDGKVSDLSGFTADTTVVAKYVDGSYLDLDYSRIGLLRVRGVTLISAVDDEDNYQDVGIMVNGEPVSSVRFASRYMLFNTPSSMFGVARGSRFVIADQSLYGSGALEVTPYWITMDGTTVLGQSHTLHYTSRSIWE